MISRSSPMDSGELARKRHRNRLAQQKYRKKLKSRIEDLEKRAAAGEREPTIPSKPDHLENDATNVFDHFPTHLGGRDGVISTYHSGPALSRSPSIHEPSAKSSDKSSSAVTINTIFSSPKQPNAVRQGMFSALSKEMVSTAPKPVTSLVDGSDFLKDFPTQDPSAWPNQKNISFHDFSELDVQSDSIDIINPLNLTSRQDALETHSLPRCISTESEQPSSLSGQIRVPSFQEETNMESRLQDILRSIQGAGFESPDSFISHYYTAVLKERSVAKLAQEASRSKGLPQVLDELRNRAGSWSMRESGGYKDGIVRSAAYLIADEFDRLTRKKYTCEIELQQDLSRTAQSSSAHADATLPIRQMQDRAAELKKTLRDELPNLYALTTSLSGQDSPLSGATRIQLLIAIMRMMTANSDQPLQEAASWVFKRASSCYKFSDDFIDEDECNSSGSIS